MRVVRTSVLLGAGLALWLAVPGCEVQAQRDPKVVRRAERGYKITPGELSRLARAGTVRARLTGQSGRCNFRLKPESLELVRLFVERELSGAAAVTSGR